MKRHFIALIALTFIFSCKPNEDTDLEVIIDDVRGNPPGNTINTTGHVGKIYRFPHSGTEFTGIQLTKNSEDNHKIYNTHSTWSKDSNWLIYMSSEGTDDPDQRTPNIFAVNMPGSNDGYEDYITIQLTSHLDLPRYNQYGGATTEDIVISRTEDVLYYLRSNYIHGEDNMPHNQSFVKVMKLDFGAIIRDACQMVNGQCTQGTMMPLSTYETTLTTNTWGNTAIGGGISLDFYNRYVYYGVNAGQSVIFRYDLNTNQNQEIYRSYSWTFGHITANQFPNTSREILFNWAPNSQMANFDTLTQTSVPHFLNVIDGNGNNYVGLYNEGNPYENPTHGTWVNSSTVGFNIVNFGTYTQTKGYCEIQKNNTGFVRRVQALSNYHESVFEHNSVVPGGRYTVLAEMDTTFAGDHSLVLYDRFNGSMTRLPINNFGTEAHSGVSPDGNWVAYEKRASGFQVHIMRLQTAPIFPPGGGRPGLIEMP